MSAIPSWERYGTHDESAYPELWEGCIGAWCPGLGPTGFLWNLAKSGMSPRPSESGGYDCQRAWVQTSQGWVLDFYPWANKQLDCGYHGTVRGKTASVVIRGSWNGTQSGVGYNGYLCGGYGSSSYDLLFLLTTNNPDTATVWFYGFAGNGGGVVGRYPGSNKLRNLVGRVYNGATVVDGFMDGVWGGTNGGYSTFQNKDLPFSIGPNAGSSGYSGYIQNVMLYDTKISEGAIQLLNKEWYAPYIRRRPRRFYSIPTYSTFLPSWARRNHSQLISGGLR